MNYTPSFDAADSVRRAMALALERPTLVNGHDAAIRRVLPHVSPMLAALYERFRAESADAALDALGEADGERVAAAVTEWVASRGDGVAADWQAVLALRPKAPMKTSDAERELRKLAARLDKATESRAAADKPFDEPDEWPQPLADEAYHGLVGDFVRAIAPHTEADPAALVAQVLAAFGNVIGRTAFFRAEADRHFSNLFACLVGPTAKGRKGSSLGQVKRLVAGVDPVWAGEHVLGGLSSGEGLIHAVRDPTFKRVPQRDGKGPKAPIVGYEEIEADAGVTDKRLLVVESEFASVLKQMLRERNILSAIIRQAWDTGDLRTLTKNSPEKATGAHISIIGHITRDELRRLITETEMANGLANRFLWFCVRRSKSLPDGGTAHKVDLRGHEWRLREAVQFAKSTGEVRRDGAARELWFAVYDDLSGGKPGLLGAATSRAEAQVMRLALVYALLDCSAEIREEHLTAALAVWEYAEASAAYAFGRALGDATADEILAALRRQAPKGMSRDEIRNHFGRNKPAPEIERALAVLFHEQLARCEKLTDTGGRPAEIWFVR